MPQRQIGLIIVLLFFAAASLSSSVLAQRYTNRSANLKNNITDSEEGEPWKSLPLLIEAPKKPYEIIGEVHAPRIFLWDDDESIKEGLQKIAWKMKADAVLLDVVDTRIQWKPTPGAKGRAIRYLK